MSLKRTNEMMGSTDAPTAPAPAATAANLAPRTQLAGEDRYELQKQLAELSAQVAGS